MLLRYLGQAGRIGLYCQASQGTFAGQCCLPSIHVEGWCRWILDCRQGESRSFWGFRSGPFFGSDTFDEARDFRCRLDFNSIFQLGLRVLWLQCVFYSLNLKTRFACLWARRYPKHHNSESTVGECRSRPDSDDLESSWRRCGPLELFAGRVTSSQAASASNAGPIPPDWRFVFDFRQESVGFQLLVWKRRRRSYRSRPLQFYRGNPCSPRSARTVPGTTF